ncbi:MAG TPA: hypothetical protein DD729_00260, partial [Rhodobacteraceae bacterium]|nr:hypothetical protein [Paracoccaceae bacterium]
VKMGKSKQQKTSRRRFLGYGAVAVAATGTVAGLRFDDGFYRRDYRVNGPSRTGSRFWRVSDTGARCARPQTV